tara:strand:+ start:152 stop:646 length:495 start_codon:yes stop_codon:yes gene_type:complete
MPENNIEEPQRLQWIKGDKFGNVETVDKEDGEFTVFKSGGKIYTNLIPEFLTSDIDAGMHVESTPSKLPPPVDISTESPTKVETSALRTLLDKQKKLDKVPMGISFSVNIPKKKIIDVLESTFDPEELHKELEDFIGDQLDTEVILNTVKDSIKILIQEKYKGV